MLKFSEDVKCYNHLCKWSGCFLKFNIHVFCDSALPSSMCLSRSSERMCSQRDLYKIIHSSLSLIVKRWMLPGCSSQVMWYSFPVWYCLSANRQTAARVPMPTHLRNVRMSERSFIKMNTYCKIQVT